MGRLDNRVSIITGGLGGLGAAMARRFCEEGAFVVVTDRSESIDRSSVTALGSSAAFIAHDVANRHDWSEVMQFAQARFGPVDILVNNAGVLRYATLECMQEADFDHLMSVNVKGVWLGMQSVIPGMLSRGRGCIINVSSTGAMLPTNGTGVYAASKAAVEAMSRTAALELGPHGIRVNSLHPGGINTPLTNPDAMETAQIDALYSDIPLQRAGHAREVANMSVFLASDEASYCTGSQFVVDGGSLAGKYHGFLPGAPGPVPAGEQT